MFIFMQGRTSVFLKSQDSIREQDKAHTLGDQVGQMFRFNDFEKAQQPTAVSSL